MRCSTCFCCSMKKYKFSKFLANNIARREAATLWDWHNNNLTRPTRDNHTYNFWANGKLVLISTFFLSTYLRTLWVHSVCLPTQIERFSNFLSRLSLGSFNQMMVFLHKPEEFEGRKCHVLKHCLSWGQMNLKLRLRIPWNIFELQIILAF